MKINNLKNDLIKALEKTLFTQRNVILLHVKLKDIKKIYNLSYDKISNIIIEVLNSTKPENIIVPTFTPAFIKNKIFDIKNSNSEVGIFSELFRKNYSKYRTKDPIFSLCHIKNYETKYKNINFLSAFNKGSIWEYFDKKNITIMNIGLSQLIASQIHYIEFISNVPYRSQEIKEGYMIDNNNKKIKINYTFYARILKNKLILDWNKIEKLLIKENKIHFTNNCPLNLKWFKAKEISSVIIPVIKKDPFYLVHSEK